ANVLQYSFAVVQTQEQGTDRVLAALVPTKPGDDAIRGARMLDLEHRPLAGLIGAIGDLGDDAVQSGAFKAFQPLAGEGAVARHGRQVQWSPHPLEELLELGPALLLCRAH